MEINFIEIVITAFLIFGCLKPEIPLWIKIAFCIFFLFDAIGEIPVFFAHLEFINPKESDEDENKGE